MGVACRSEVVRLASEGFEVTYAAPDVGGMGTAPAYATLSTVRVPATVRDVRGMLHARSDLQALVHSRGPACIVHAHGLRSGLVAAGLTSGNRIIVTHHGSPDLDIQRRVYARLLPKRVWKAISVVPLDISGWTHWWHWSPILDELEGTRGRDKWVPLKAPVSDGALVVGWFGWVDRPKRPDVWLNILNEVRAEGHAVRGVVVGDGPLLLQMQSLATDLNLPVDFMGRQNPTTAMASMDLLLTWSDFEGVPFVIQEAVALGVPALTNDPPGPQALLGDSGGVMNRSTAPQLVGALADPIERAALLEGQQQRLQNLRSEGSAEDRVIAALT